MGVVKDGVNGLLTGVEFDAVFGYGSLMNPGTHDYAGLGAARLPGWRRVWRALPDRQVAILSVEPADRMLLGATALVPAVAWPALDAREVLYDRHEVGASVMPPAGRVALYVVPEAAPGPPVPIRLSYLDTVVAGALRLHGTAGAADVFAAGGWGRVLDDRAAPLYPRAQRLAPEEEAVVDAGLVRLGVPVTRPDAAPDGCAGGA